MASGLLRLIALLVLAAVAGTASADSMAPVQLDPIEHSDAQLTVTGPDGASVTYTVSALETFDTYRVVTVTPWRKTPATFEGVLLRDVLAASDLDAVSAIRVTAENDFSSDLEQEIWMSVPVMVATRVDGRPISRRERGPLLFVVEDALYQASAATQERHLVWMAARIEPLL